MLRIILAILLIAPAAYAEDLEILTRPESIVVETLPGNLTPMERVFFHIVLHNISQGQVEVQWLRFDMLNSTGALLSGQYAGNALTSLFDSAVNRRRIEPTPKGTLILGADERKAISDIFFDCPAGFIGESVTVEVSYKADNKVSSKKVDVLLRRAVGFTGRLPFDGTWYVAAEHGYLDPHKRFLAEAYAYDFLQIGAGGKSFQGNGARNIDYYAYGKKVLAAKDGTVVSVKNDIVDNTPGSTNFNTPGGNVVVIDHGNGQFGYYAHLKPNSISVKAGAKVRAGDPVGEVGNSGDTVEPHLHFHVMNGPNPSEADGIPAVFANWKAESYGASPSARELGILPRGEFVEPGDGKTGTAEIPGR